MPNAPFAIVRLLFVSAVCFAVFGLASHAAAQSCTNYACFQVSCLGGATTSISGTTYAPNGVDPIPNVLVFVPNGTVEPFVDGPADDTEASLVTGDPLVMTTSMANGTFTLTNVPAGTGFPLVLQAGRWRRQLTVPSLTSCVNTPVANFNPPMDVFSRFPKTQVEGDIPKMALATGGVDALECSLRKVGIADTEFTDYTVNVTGLSSPGRINLFEGAGNSGAKAGSIVHTENQLVGSTSATIGGSLLGGYNVLLLPCQGTFGYTTADGRGNAITFAGEGGRIFATHHSDTYLDQDAAIDGAADWRGDANSDSIGSGEATIDTGFSSGMTLAQWMQDIGATTNLGQVAMSSLFSDQTGINAPTQSWATFNSAEFGVATPVLQLSFYTPVGAAAADQFGRVMYNEYHVDNTSTNSSVTFPAECTGALAKTAAFTAQEHMLEYSLFDLMNFAVPVVTPTVSLGITTSTLPFTGGSVGDTVTVTVGNTGSAAIATTPTVYLTVTLPAGLTPVAMSDALGLWTCTASTLTCTLTSAWNAGISDPVTVTLDVAANVSPGSPSVSATVSSAGFSSNLSTPIMITVAAAPPGTVTSGPAVSAGTVELRSTAPATANFAISAGTTVGTISVVTQGATGLDFTNAGSGTCTTTTYESTAACTVNVTFSPTHPGPRLGAVRILDGSGNLLGTQYVTAIGVAPQVIFSPSVQSALGGGFNQPYGVATDSSGNIYLADQANNAVQKIPSGCATAGCVITLGGGFSSPYGVAVDGAGNVVVADSGNFAVKLIPVGCATSTCVVALGGAIGSPASLAVDGDGNVFVADPGDNLVTEIPQGCFASGCMIFLGGGFSNPSGIALDGNGNVLVADSGNSAVKELSYTCLASSCVSTVGGGISQPDSLAVDASGNVFVGDQGSTSVREIPSGCTTSACVSTLSGIFLQPFGLALDGSGNVFVGDASATTVAKLDFSDPPALAYASLHVGAASSPQAVTVSNDGNAALAFTSSGLAAPTDFIQVAGSGTPPDCANSGTVIAGASCNLSIEFSPLSTGALLESFVLTDNDLNASAATQSISLSGTGLAADATGVGLGVSPNSPLPGQAVTITATVSDITSAGTVPTGGVTFSDSVDGNLNGGAAVTLVSGVASLAGVILSGGGGTAHTVTANYQGVVNLFLASSNSATVHLASLTATSTVLVAAPNPAGAGAAVNLTATISPAPTGSPLGTVSFYDGETLLGSGNVNSSGVATLSSSGLAVGGHTLTAVYSGNAAYATSTSSAVTETIEAATSTALTALPNPAVAGQSVTLTATVSPAPSGSALGTVSFYDGETLLGSANVNSSGIATLSSSSLAVGAHTLTAVYSGNTGFAASTSGSVTETVNAAETSIATATALTGTPNPAGAGQSVTFTATVSPAPTGSSLGTVSFYDGETLLGSVSVSSSGAAMFSTTSLPAGSDVITAVYSGNAGFAGSTSSAFTETVNTAYTVTAPPLPVPVAEGGSVQINVTVPPLGGPFNNLVTLSASGLPPGATASFNPPAVTPGSAGAPSVMTIQLAPLTAAVVPGSGGSHYRHWPVAWVGLVIGLCGAGLRGKPSSAKATRKLALAILAAAIFTLTGCGGGWLGSATTAPGSYVVTITGSSGSLQASTTVTVVVQ